MPTPENVIKERRMTVARHNYTIQEFRYELSSTGQKLLLYLISKIKPGDTEDTTYQLDVQTLCEVCGMKPNRKLYSDFKKLVQQLAGSSFWVEGGNREELHSWITKPAIIDKTVFEFSFDPFVQPYLLHLTQNYTSYELEYILAMRSKYAIRMYEYLKSYAYQGIHETTLDTLRNILNVDGYPEFNNFKVRVLEPAVEEINLFTDIYVTYDLIRTGLQIGKLRFNIIPKYPGEDTVAFANRQEALSND